MAYLCLQHAWNKNEGIGVDVHVHRISNRLHWVHTKTPEQTRQALEDWLPKEYWQVVNTMLVGFGQTICKPVGPKCTTCLLSKTCPTGIELLSPDAQDKKKNARSPSKKNNVEKKAAKVKSEPRSAGGKRRRVTIKYEEDESSEESDDDDDDDYETRPSRMRSVKREQLVSPRKRAAPAASKTTARSPTKRIKTEPTEKAAEEVEEQPRRVSISSRRLSGSPSSISNGTTSTASVVLSKTAANAPASTDAADTEVITTHSQQPTISSFFEKQSD
eukprot:TRINITY_DN3961_c0_g1_i1.p1 TRINITY_DN3961_c0_g1~~TRINITY_DN3961_c0_g1_i1.p1  ORF type:complete len:274 (+),score=55.35 TRINITY_DN3961_c0_g1_i1:525-1346(+)